ncbi:GlxA family transcriptional regulator [Streptomyces boninensis]|uniref:GlxA family transcriptional regulator n=1 Tax=Streptomyces boninensis TaxID=2039455 RepID=UPI003B228CF6
MLKNVACVLTHDVNAFELGVICEVFGIDRSDQGLPVYDFATVAGEEPPIRLHPGMTVSVSDGLDRIAEADLVAVPAGQQYPSREFPEELLKALRAAVDRGAYVLSVCTGAFLLGHAGLLDGRRCTTHWRYADAMARLYPRAELEPGVLYVQDGQIITSAGTASGIDACLALVRQEQGSKVANAIARRMVVPPHRDGGQAQYIQRPVPEQCGDDAVGEALTWMQNHLDEECTVEELAGRVHLAPRTFARRFQQETGTTPYQWMLGQRVLLAQHLLEETDLTVDAIAARTGFGNAATLRHHFMRRLDTTPNAYRRTFRGPQSVGA